MGGVEFSLGTLNLCQGIGTEEVWISHEDMQRQDDDVHVAQETRVVDETRVVELEFYTEAFTCHETRVVQSVEEKRVVEQEYYEFGIAEHNAEQISKCEAMVKSAEGSRNKVPSAKPL